jgi:hypothetical protein
MDTEQWYLRFKVRAEIVLPGVQQATINSEGESAGDTGQIAQLNFSKADEPGAYDVTAQLRASGEDEAWSRANWWSQEVLSVLSFLTSRKVRIQNMYVTSARATGDPSKTGRMMLALDAATTIASPPVVNPNDLCVLLRVRSERESRALRWLRKARETRDPIDEFICLVIALECISHLLGPNDQVYWRCARCQDEMKSCPKCGYSTKRKKSGAEILRDFTVGTLGWSERDWRVVWSIRNAVLHGERDMSSKRIGERLFAFLPKVEFALVCALKILANLPATHAPTTLGIRGLMLGAVTYPPMPPPAPDSPGDTP